MIGIRAELSVVSKVFCNSCQRETNHAVQASYDVREPLDGGRHWEVVTVELWRCAGCDSGVMVTTEGIEGEDEPCSLTFDPPRSRSHVKPKTFRKLPKQLSLIYRQSARAFNADLNVLCAAGLRALIEGVCADRGRKGKDLQQKIDDLEPILPKALVANLHSFRFMGNDAVHQLKAPTQDELRMAISVAEDLLNYLYELDYKAQLLAEKIFSARGRRGGSATPDPEVVRVSPATPEGEGA